MTARDLTPHTANMPASSLREKSIPDLIQATRSAGDEAYILERIRIVSKAYYNPEMSDVDRAALYDEYRKALKSYPRWAVARAFDEWVKTGDHRPSPRNLVILAEKALRPLHDEIARRERINAEREAARMDEARRKTLLNALTAEQVCQRAGFTPRRLLAAQQKPMARSEDELFAEPDTRSKPHWTETVPANDPQMQQLIRARLENPLMRDGMLKAGYEDPETEEERAFRLHAQERHDPE